MESSQAEVVAQLVRAHEQQAKAQGSVSSNSLTHSGTQASYYWQSYTTWQGTKHINTEIIQRPALEKWGQMI